MLKEKKAISALVATVLLVLITVAAVGIIWGAIMPMITENMQFGPVCSKARMDTLIDTALGYTCFNESNNELKVMVKRGAEIYNLTGLQITVTGETPTGAGISKNYEIKAGKKYTAIRESDKGYDQAIELPPQGEGLTYVINASVAIKKPQSAAVAAMVKIGNIERICDAGVPVIIEKCI